MLFTCSSQSLSKCHDKPAPRGVGGPLAGAVVAVDVLRIVVLGLTNIIIEAEAGLYRGVPTK